MDVIRGRLVNFTFCGNRHGVAGAGLQPALPLIDWLTDLLTDWFFSSQSSRHHKSQTVRARELKFWENVGPHHVSHVTCHVSYVRCQVSCVRCQVAGVRCDIFSFFSDKVVELVGRVSVINGAYPIKFFWIKVLLLREKNSFILL